MVLSVLPIMPISAFALTALYDGQTGECGSRVLWKYNLINGVGTLTISGKGEMNDYSAGSPGAQNTNVSPFYQSYIENVVIEDGVESIGDYVFHWCSKLKSVTIPSSVKSIGSYAFYSCPMLESVIIPDSVETIKSNAFKDCSSLKSVTLSNNIKTVSWAAFVNCESLESIVIPDGVKSIDDLAFEGCDKLKTVVIPESVTSVGIRAFRACPLTNVFYLSTPEKAAAITIDDSYSANDALKNATWYYNGGQCGDNVYYGFSEDGETLALFGTGATWDYTFDMSQSPICTSPFYDNSNLEKIIVEDGITEIGDYLFMNCFNTISVSVPSTVTRLGKNSMQGLKFVSFDIPEGVTSIAEYAFCNCQQLESVTIPEGVTSIADNTFKYCYNISSITVPQNVTYVGAGAFSGMVALTDLFAPSGVDLSGASVPAETSIWRYEVLADQTGAPAGKTLVKIVSRDQGTATTVPCNMNDDRYVVSSVEVDGVEIAHSYENYVCTDCGNTNYITEISSVDDLKEFAQTVNGGYDYSGETVTLEKDIVCSSVTDWTPIGLYGVPFSGVFDGKGHTITGLNNTDNPTEYAGLFGFVSSVTVDGEIIKPVIKNVGLVGGKITGTFRTGSIVGDINYGIIQNCYNTGDVACTGGSCGGLVGFCGTSTLLTNCYNTGNVIANGDCGGLTGYNYGEISNCYNTGNVTCNNEDYSVGGITGGNGGTIENSYNTGNVTGIQTVGGIAGYSSDNLINEALIRNCYNTGTVTVNSGDIAYAGGIAGYASATGYNSSIESCYNTGDIIFNGKTIYAGGVVGYNTSASHSDKVSGITNCYNVGNINVDFSRSAIVGGVVGYNQANEDRPSGSEVSRCYSAGNIINKTAKSMYAGGVIGENEYAQVSNCYYDKTVCSDVTALYNTNDTENVKGLTTAQMTAGTYTDGAVTNMPGLTSSVWLVKEGSDFYSYYPHLKGFVYDSTEDVSDWPAGGLNTSDSLYYISNYQELKLFAQIVNGGNYTANAVLTDDIVCKNNENDESYATDWTPIGTDNTKSFRGVFDGDGHTITGLNNTDNPNDYGGLFGFVKGVYEDDEIIGGIVKNVGMVDGILIATQYAGSIIGWSDHGTVINCYNTGSVNSEENAGGVIGYSEHGTAINCYNTGSVNGKDNTGGVIGFNNRGTINNCHNTGGVNGEEHVGGLVGYNSGGAIKSCYNTGDVTSTYSYGNAAGIAGWQEGTLEYCYNTGHITSPFYAGGIAAYVESSVTGASTDAIIRCCYNAGDITVNGADYGNYTLPEAGGIAAYVYCLNYNAYIQNCYNTGDIFASGHSVYIGGVVGVLYQYIDETTEVSNCYNAGKIIGNGDNLFLGGVAATIRNGTLTNCYYDKNICFDLTAVYNTNDTENVKGLTTAQMTGKAANEESNMKALLDAKDDMGEKIWLDPKRDGMDDNGNSIWYYPHLKGFDFADGGLQAVGGVVGYDTGGTVGNIYNTGAVNNSTQLTAEEISADKWPAKVEVKSWWEGETEYTYDGSEQKPTVVKVIVGDDSVPEDARNIVYRQYDDGSWRDVEGIDSTEAGSYMLVYTVYGNTVTKFFTILDSSDYTVSYKVNNGSSWNSALEVINAGSYRAVLNFTDSGHEAITKGFIINPKDITVTVNGNSSELTYSGSEQTFNGTFTATSSDTGFDAAKFSYSGSTSVSGTTVGDYTLAPVTSNASYADDNFNVTFVAGDSIKLTIKKRPITVTINGNSSEVTYSGSEQTFNGTFTATSTDSLFNAAKFSYSGTTSVSGTTVGDYTLTPVTSNAAYNDNNFSANFVAGSDIKLTINPKAVTITAGSHEFTYNGTAQSWNDYFVDGLCGNDAISATVSGSITFPTQNTVANTVTNYQFTTGNKDNYTVSKVPGSLTMKWAEAPLTITAASHTWAYDGAAHKDEAVTAAVGGLFNGDILVATATGSVTNVADTATSNNPIASGYKVMHGEMDVSDNYVITPQAGTLTITARPITSNDISVESIADVEYNGNAQEPAVTVKDGDKTLLRNTDYTVSYSNNTNATTNGAKVTISGMGNYKDSVDVYFTIKKAPISPTVTLEGWTYGETANTPEVKGNSGNADVSFQYKSDNTDYTEEQPVLPGNYTVLATVAESPNYLGGEATAEFRIAYPEGWYEENGNKYYCSGDEILTDWQEIEGEWYYLGDDGAVQTGWQEVPYKNSTRVYYFDENGVAAQGWKKIDGDWYYFNICARQTGWRHIDDNWYYFDEDGKMQTGWLKDGGNWYYLKSSGAMATGWTKVDGKWYYMDCRLSYLGIMQTGWQRIDGDWYYMNKSGVMQTGWLRDAGNWYYLDAHGKMLKSVTRKIDGKSYTFDAHGVCTNA